MVRIVYHYNRANLIECPGGKQDPVEDVGASLSLVNALVSQNDVQTCLYLVHSSHRNETASNYARADDTVSDRSDGG